MFPDMYGYDNSETVTLSGNQTNLIQYFDALWGFYGLVQSEAGNCFNNAQASAYFASIGYQYQYLGSLMAPSRTNAAYYAALLQSLNATLFPAMECFFNTSDAHLLFYQAGITFFNRTIFNFLSQVYFQGRFDDYYLAFNPVYTQLFNRQYAEAGYTYGPILYTQINNASMALAWDNAIGAFQNALFFDYNISSPTEFSDCYNDFTAHTHLSLYYLWSQTVNNSTVSNCVANTQAFFNTTGKALFEQIEPTVACLDRTNDQARLDNAVGTPLNSPQWWNATHEFLANSPSTYYTIFTQIYKEFASYNPGYAGYLYGTFISAVNASIASQEEF
jgi:hypothetical protein